MDSDNESTGSESTGENDEADDMALVEDSIEGAERDITEGTDLLAGTETETEDTRNKTRYIQICRYRQWSTHKT